VRWRGLVSGKERGAALRSMDQERRKGAGRVGGEARVK
jgi:hypothetical protein